MSQVLTLFKYHSKFVVVSFLFIALLLQPSLPTLAAVVYRTSQKSNYHTVQKLKSTKIKKYKPDKALKLNCMPVSIVFISIAGAAILLGFILGALYAIPLLWIPCLIVLSIGFLIGIFFFVRYLAGLSLGSMG
jgi:hypothetical protein